MMWWSWVLTAVGLTGFILAGRKIWWCWYINIGCQALWMTYAIQTEQYGFIVASLFYTVVFAQNARSWTKEHMEDRDMVDAIEHVKDIDFNEVAYGGLIFEIPKAVYKSNVVNGYCKNESSPCATVEGCHNDACIFRGFDSPYPDWERPEDGWQHWCSVHGWRVVGLRNFHEVCAYGCGVAQPALEEGE